ncbi:MAG: hypothetical protein H5T69_09380 [Chloroflexi bacterium]|nr:hypothetical protein [Chloroflexota bacterium]
MRRHAVIGLVALLVLMLTPVAVSAAPATPSSESHPVVAAPPLFGPPTVVRAKYGLRLRTGPSLVDPVILVLRNGETVYPGGGPVYNQGISWTYVRVIRWGRAYEGFCATAYLASFGGYTPTGESGLKVIAPAGLHLRLGPGTGYRVARTVPYGTILKPTGIYQWNGGIKWTKVGIDGVFLWAAAAYLRPV